MILLKKVFWKSFFADYRVILWIIACIIDTSVLICYVNHIYMSNWINAVFYLLNVVALCFGVKMFFELHSEKKLTKMLNLEKLYLCGFSIERYRTTKAFWRFADYCDSGICHELAAVSMMALKGNKTAVFCQGTDVIDGEIASHSWVEFKMLGSWYVLDLAWRLCVVSKKRYYKYYPDRIVKWRCSYDEFWKIDLSNEIYDRMQNQRTSFVMDYLIAYASDVSAKEGNFGFCDFLYELHVRKPEHCSAGYMIPFECGKGILWVSTLRDFAKYPKSERPKARSIRIANSVMRQYKKISQQPSEAPA